MATRRSTLNHEIKLVTAFEFTIRLHAGEPLRSLAFAEQRLRQLPQFLSEFLLAEAGETLVWFRTPARTPRASEAVNNLIS